MQWNATGSVKRKASRPDQRWIAADRGAEILDHPRQLPEDPRAAVTIWITAKKTAAVANHALPAIVVVKTDVTMSVYVEFTLASGIVAADATQYDPPVSTPGTVRLRRVLPLVLFLGVSGVVSRSRSCIPPGRDCRRPRPEKRSCSATSTTARRCSTPSAPPVTARTASTAAIGPTLAGRADPARAREGPHRYGGATMPAKLVSGQQERDVLAFLATIVAAPR